MLKIAAASDLMYAFEEVAAKFQQETGSEVTLLFGSSGQYARQLAQGAPFDVFASADVDYVESLANEGVCDGATKSVYAKGRLVLWTAKGVEKASYLSDLSAPRFKRISLADPEQAPYGRAAKQTLVAAGLWGQLQDRIQLAENIQQAMAQVDSGQADAALVAHSLTKRIPSRGKSPKGQLSFLIDEALHEPLTQALIVCNRGASKELGIRFAAYLLSPAGRRIMEGYGYSRPTAAPAQASPSRALP